MILVKLEINFQVLARQIKQIKLDNKLVRPWTSCPLLSAKTNKQQYLARCPLGLQDGISPQALSCLCRTNERLLLKSPAMPWFNSVKFLHTIKFRQILSGIKAGFEDHITGGNIYMLHLILHWFNFTEFKGLSDSLLTKWPCVFPFLTSSPNPQALH